MHSYSWPSSLGPISNAKGLCGNGHRGSTKCPFEHECCSSWGWYLLFLKERINVTVKVRRDSRSLRRRMCRRSMLSPTETTGNHLAGIHVLRWRTGGIRPVQRPKDTLLQSLWMVRHVTRPLRQGELSEWALRIRGRTEEINVMI